MAIASGINELWRRMALLLGILMGLAMFFYVAPAMVSVTAVDWAQEQTDELKSSSGMVSSERKRLSQLPLNEYIQEKTGGRIVALNAGQWRDFFTQVQLAGSGQYEKSVYGNRVSEADTDDFWRPGGLVAVYFKPDEIPWVDWGLLPEDGQTGYISISAAGQTAYLELRYHDYSSTVGPMSSPYRVAPGWLFHPYRTSGMAVMAAGLLLYLFLPRRKNQPQDIAYSAGSGLAADLAAVILLTPFYGLPFLINGGALQAVTGWWPITAAMWLLAAIAAMLFYYNAWSSSFRIELTPEALYLVSFKGVRAYSFNEISAAEVVTLRNPGWFRKLFLGFALLSLLGGRSSPQPAGSALLAATASYGGLEIKGRMGKPLYIWFTDQHGSVIINNFDRVTEALAVSGVHIVQEAREVEGFSMFM